MRTLAWIGVGWLGATLCSAVGSRLSMAHVMPDMAVIVVVFLAMRRSPVSLCAAALALGYLMGRQALAPVGLHETALVAVAVVVYMAAGNLTGSGALFFACASGAAVAGYHAAVFALLYWQRGRAGFSSWATAGLLPDALTTLVTAAICHPAMRWLERRMVQERREGLTWR